MPLRKQHHPNLLLLQNLLSCHPGISPFTLVQDTLEQPARGLLRHYVRNAKASKCSTLFVSYENITPPESISSFIQARRKDPDSVREELIRAVKKNADRRSLIIIDSLHPLCALPPPFNLPAFLSSLLSLSPQLSLVVVYHLDVPLASGTQDQYAPSPLTLLRYLATTILTTHSLSHTLAKKKARDRSLAEPLFGIGEEIEGVLVGIKDRADAGMVLEMEHRRKSGRVGGAGTFYLPPSSSAEKPQMLEDHPLLQAQARDDAGQEDEETEGTFELGLTEKQRKDREGVVLPYFDAQTGNAEGGRILYDMGVEDDFDEEEDEI